MIDGKVVTIVAKFRRFASLSEAFELHGKLLSTGSPYRTAMQVVANPEAFADALTGVYATDPQYGTTLKWVMENYKLRRRQLSRIAARLLQKVDHDMWLLGHTRCSAATERGRQAAKLSRYV